MESEEAIMENENNSNLESCIRDREQKQTDEGLLNDVNSSTRASQELLPELTLQEDSNSYLSTENLSDAANKASNSTANESYIEQNDNFELDESADNTTALSINASEDLPDYEEFIGIDDNEQNKRNIQPTLSENIDQESIFNEGQQNKEFSNSSSQGQIDDNFSLDPVESSDAGYSKHKSGDLQINIDEIADSTSRSESLNSQEKEAEVNDDELYTSHRLAAAEIYETSQSRLSKNMSSDSAKYWDGNIDLLGEDSTYSFNQEETAAGREVLMNEKAIPSPSCQDNAFEVVSEEFSASLDAQKIIDIEHMPEESLELPSEVEKFEQITSKRGTSFMETESVGSISPEDTTDLEKSEDAKEIPTDSSHNNSHTQNVVKGFEELENMMQHMKHVVPSEEPMDVLDAPDLPFSTQHVSVTENIDDDEAARQATSEDTETFEDNVTLDVSSRMKTDLLRNEHVSDKINSKFFNVSGASMPAGEIYPTVEPDDITENIISKTVQSDIVSDNATSKASVSEEAIYKDHDSDIVSDDRVSNDLETNIITEEARSKGWEPDIDSEDGPSRDLECKIVVDNAASEDELEIFTSKDIVTEETTSSDMKLDSVREDVKSENESDVAIKDADSEVNNSVIVTGDAQSEVSESESVTENAESEVGKSEIGEEDAASEIDVSENVTEEAKSENDESEIVPQYAESEVDEIYIFREHATSKVNECDIISEDVISKVNESEIGSEDIPKEKSDTVREGAELQAIESDIVTEGAKSQNESDIMTEDTLTKTNSSEIITEDEVSKDSSNVISPVDHAGSKLITTAEPEEELAALVNSFTQDKNDSSVNVTDETLDVHEAGNQHIALSNIPETLSTPVVLASDKNNILEEYEMEASKDIFYNNNASLNKAESRQSTSSEHQTHFNIIANEGKTPDQEVMESSNTESSRLQQKEESLEAEMDPDLSQYCSADLSLGDTFDQVISEPIEEAKSTTLEINETSESLETSLEPAANTGDLITTITNFKSNESENKEDRINRSNAGEDSPDDAQFVQIISESIEATCVTPEPMETNESAQKYFEQKVGLDNLQTIKIYASEKDNEEQEDTVNINTKTSSTCTDSVENENDGTESQKMAMGILETESESITTDVNELADESMGTLKDESISSEMAKQNLSLSEYVKQDAVTSESLQQKLASPESLQNLSQSKSKKQDLADTEGIKQDSASFDSEKGNILTLENLQDSASSESVKQDLSISESLQKDEESRENVKQDKVPLESVKEDYNIDKTEDSGEDDMAVDDEVVPVKDETDIKNVAENGLDVKDSSASMYPDEKLLEITDKSQDITSNEEIKKSESPKSKSSKTKITTCLVCQKICKCKYNIVRNGEVKHLCDDVCFQQFRKTPNDFLKTAEPVKTSRTSSRTTKSTPKSGPPVKDALALYQQEMATRQSNNYKTCSVCQLLNLNPSQPYCSWKGLDFCGESCLGKFQASLNTSCSFCHAYIPLDMRSTCCVKIGNDMRPFCKQRCYNEFKKKLRLCACCQRDIAGVSGAFTAMVGTEGRFKEFCSQMCMKKLESETTDFEVLSLAKGGVKQEIITCGLCKKQGSLKYSVKFQSKWTKLCSDICLSAFKFTNKINLDMCDSCSTTCTAEEAQAHFVQYGGEVKRFCSDNCVSLFRKANNKVVQCDWCVTKKLNFDMIEKQDGDKLQMFCSLNCLSLYRVNQQAKSGQVVPCDQCRKVESAQYHLTMSDASVRNFCSYSCVMTFQSHFATKHTSPATGPQTSTVPLSQLQPQPPASMVQHPQQQGVPASKSSRTRTKTRHALASQQSPTIPVISNVVSLAGQGGQGDYKSQTKPNLQSPSQGTVQPSPASQVKTPTATGNLVPSADGKHQILIQEPPPKCGKNKSLQCKPATLTKATSCRPHTQTKDTQTEDIAPKCVVIPIPVPIYVPMPTVMFTAPAPKLVPFPIPIPVPIFIPTTRKSANGICKAIQDIVERMPADPLEAEILMMAEAVAGDKRPGDSDTDSEGDNCAEEFSVPVEVMRPVPREDESLMMRKREGQGEEDMIQMALRMAEEMSGPIEDLEASVEPVAVSSEAPLNQQQHHNIQGYENQVEEEYIPARPNQQRVPKRANRGRPPPSRVKRVCTERPYNQDESMQSESSIQLQSMEPPPDANYRLKFTYGVNAWRHWVISKNAQIEKMRQTTGGHRLRPFSTDILKCTVDELNYTLCMFIREVRKPNGGEYSPDSIYYLCLGIQQYLNENNRIDNIFTDTYFEKFTDCLNEILKNIQPKINSQGQMLCRIEEEHLWESKQLGAHSPFILLNTLIYFHTKHFILKTAQEHMSLSFAQILKHWKKGMPLKGQNLASGKNVSLRFYCLSNGKKDGLAARKNKDGFPVYEVTENFDNPLRCPVKLYEFFLSKCPESIKNRNDIFYPMPERSCVPDSPVWYSTQSIDIHTMDKMLTRILLVREIQEAHLHVQSMYM